MLGLIQFMFVIDATVVNVALPRIQHDLGFSRPGLAWVVDGYVLMAAGLLLLGGRLADIFGRRRMFLIGVVVFGVASVASGAAITSEMLVASRFVQGVGEALGVPAALGLVLMLFSDSRERMKAVGIWGGVSGLAGTLGVVISGVLTDLVSWRWIFYINVPIVLIALFLVPRLVSESQMVREDHRFDFAGAITATGGLAAIVYGLLQAVSHPWGSWQVLMPLLGGLALLALMVLIEARSLTPLIPLRFFTDRTRVGSYLVILVAGCVFFTYVFLLTLFEQQVLGYSPLKGGLFYLPLGLEIGVGVGISTALMPRLGAKLLMFVGLVGTAVGLLLTSGIHVGTSYASGVLPGMSMFGVFFGMVMPTTANTALHKVTGQDSSLASAVLNAMQQIGGALGLAGSATIALRYAASQIHDGVPPDVAATEGYALAFRIAAVLLVLGAVLAVILLENVKPQPESAEAAPVASTPAGPSEAVPAAQL
ncbi:MAG: MFS transporter [Actinobacteria bacterium]|nr:MFS transporter [Actinomycetota bacterium]